MGWCSSIGGWGTGWWGPRGGGYDGKNGFLFELRRCVMTCFFFLNIDIFLENNLHKWTFTDNIKLIMRALFSCI